MSDVRIPQPPPSAGPRPGDRVVVAMSGGVDSSVTAALLVEAGYEVIGLALKLTDAPQSPQRATGTCCSPDDLYDARRVADTLGIPFYVSDARERFQAEVIDRFTVDYLGGRTPNPCVRCNDKVKFARLFQLAASLDAPWLATGHYARISRDADGVCRLLQAADERKDQSYFLFNLSQPHLQRLLLPLGGLTKPEVRAWAETRGLPTASKHESMEICFVGDGSYADFVARRAEQAALPPPGDIVAEDGTVLGHHEGIHRFTVGQRRGLALPGGQDPMYVLDLAGDRLVVGPERSLWKHGLVATDLKWTRGVPPPEGARFDVRIRHRGPLTPARLVSLRETQAWIALDAPQRAVSPGQAVVAYDGPEVLGGGWILGPWDPVHCEQPGDVTVPAHQQMGDGPQGEDKRCDSA